MMRRTNLLGKLGDSQRIVGASSLGSEWGESGHEEMETREGNHVDGEFAEIGIQLTRETKTGSHSRHRHRD